MRNVQPAVRYRSISELPSVDGDSRGGVFSSWNRRQLLQRTFGGAVALSLTSLNLLPPAQRAYATHLGSEGYHIKDGCGGDFGSTDCTLGCGPSNVCGNMSGGPCCVTEAGAHQQGYHRANGREWQLRPNQCVPGTGWDGWKWNYPNQCGCCRGGITYRCHDGKNCDSSGNNCVPRVCRWVVDCFLPC